MRYVKLIIHLLLLVVFISPFINIVKPDNNFFFSDRLLLSLSIGLFIIIYLVIYRFTIINSLNLIDLFVILFYSLCLINILITNKNLLFENEFILQTCLVILYFALKHFFSKERNPFYNENSIIFLIITFCCIPVFISILEIIKIVKPFDNRFPVMGGFLNPASLANFLSASISFICALLIIAPFQKKKYKIISIVLLSLTIILLILLNARAAWIATFISFLFICFYVKKPISFKFNFFKSKILNLLSIILIFLISISLAFLLYYYKKDSADGRMYIWKICYTIIKEKPFEGNGYKSYINLYNNTSAKYINNHPEDNKNRLLAGEATYAFNDFLQITVELGLIGLVIFFGIFFFTFNNKIIHEEHKNKIIAVKSGILSIMVSAMFSYTLQIGINMFLLYFFIAYISSMVKPILMFNEKNIILKVISIFLLIILFIAEYKQTTRCYYTQKWAEANELFEQNKINKAIEEYTKLEPKFSKDNNFLFNYGSVLLQANNFEKSIKMLESAKNILTSYDLFCNLGYCYERAGNNNKAQECYKMASNLVPYLISPNYELFKSYLKTNQKDKANKIAIKIDNMPIKIYSDIAVTIKNDIKKYIYNNNLYK